MYLRLPASVLDIKTPMRSNELKAKAFKIENSACGLNGYFDLKYLVQVFGVMSDRRRVRWERGGTAEMFGKSRYGARGLKPFLGLL